MGPKMPKKEIDKYTFKICEAVKLGLDKFFLEENKPIKITEAHTDFAKRIIPTLPPGNRHRPEKKTNGVSFM